MTDDAPDKTSARDEAIRSWKQESEDTRRLGRQFSGDRLRRVARSEWLTKGAFALGTAAVVLFIVTHGGRDERARKRQERLAAQIEEPSVRGYRPPVMPLEVQSAPPKAPPLSRGPVEKPSGPRQIDAEAAARRRKGEQLEEARTKSNILVMATGGAQTLPAGATPAAAVSSSADPAAPVATRSGNRAVPASAGPEDPNRRFARQMSGRSVATAFPRKLGDLRCMALQGKMIDAELETAISTDLPGQIRAIVSSPLYAEQGTEPLIPVGSRLNGVYNSSVRKGQVRVFAIWNRVIRPDGVEIELDSAATDALGRAGLLGETDNHLGQVFGMSALLSVIGAGAGTIGVSPDAQYNSAAAYRSGVQQSFARTSDRVLEPYASIPPTNTVAQGARIKVLLNRDLDFCPLEAAAARDRGELVLP